MVRLLVIFLMLLIQQESFKEIQKKNTRVKSAYASSEAIVKKYFTDKNLSYSGFQLFIRAFKKERKVEIWIKEKNKETYSFLHAYDFCASSGSLGPKRKEGDLQIPEGIYSINHFNPVSNFHLSLGVNYPNASDKILSDKRKPGGLIYIHGNCVTIGCIPITDEKIKELYILAVEAKNNGQEKIPVHIFPTHLSNKNLNDIKVSNNNGDNSAFWKNLQPIYQDFETSKKLKKVKVLNTGAYALD
jgi:murein L,D-transpeptidase YafK